MTRSLAALAVVVLSSAALYAAVDGEPRSTQSGVFTEEQADRGSKVFEQTCIACHQPDEFSQPGYMESWSGQKASDLMNLIRTTMPQDNPGRLDRMEYIDVVAYLFQRSGLPAGDVEMDETSIEDVLIEGPFAAPE